MSERKMLWITLPYLAAHNACGSGMPSHDELGLAPVITAAKSCGMFRSDPAHDYASMSSEVPLADDPWREIAGLAGSIGESLMLACACDIEVECHRRAQAAHAEPPRMVLGQRFLAEAQGQAVVSVGHRLANLAARALAADPQLRQHMAANKELDRFAAEFRPFSERSAAWISLNKDKAKALVQIAQYSVHPAVAELSGLVKAAEADPVWRSLAGQRGEDFHRWRKESALLAGVDKESGYVSDLTDSNGRFSGKVLGGYRPYTAGDLKHDDIAATAHNALIAISSYTERIIRALYRAVEPLSRGAYAWHPDGYLSTTAIGVQWLEASCTCCQ